MGFGEKLLSLVFEVEESDKNKEKKTKANPLPVIAAEVKHESYSKPLANQASSIAEIDQEDRKKMEDYFIKFFDSLNCPKPSYHEFIAMVDNLSSLQEDLRFNTAFIGMKTMGLTKKVLVETTKSTLDGIKANTDEYNLAVKNKIENEVGGKKTEIKNNEEAIQKLKNQIAEIENRNEQLSKEVVQVETSIIKNLNNFNLYSSKIMDKVNSDLNNIESYIKDEN